MTWGRRHLRGGDARPAGATRLTVPRATVSSLVGLLVLAVLAAGCSSSSRELAVLRAEPLSSATFDGLHLVSEDFRDAQDSGDTVTGKSVDAKVTRVFEPDDAAGLRHHLAEVVRQATTDGWQEKFSFPTSFTAHKRLDEGTGQVDVVLAPCGDRTCLYLYLTLL